MSLVYSVPLSIVCTEVTRISADMISTCQSDTLSVWQCATRVVTCNISVSLDDVFHG